MRRRHQHITPSDIQRLQVTVNKIETLLRQQNALLKSIVNNSKKEDK